MARGDRARRAGPLRGFARAGWGEGAYESFAYTEVNDTVALGADLRGSPWHRAGDKLGLTLVLSGRAYIDI